MSHARHPRPHTQGRRPGAHTGIGCRETLDLDPRLDALGRRTNDAADNLARRARQQIDQQRVLAYIT